MTPATSSRVHRYLSNVRNVTTRASIPSVSARHAHRRATSRPWLSFAYHVPRATDRALDPLPELACAIRTAQKRIEANEPTCSKPTRTYAARAALLYALTYKLGTRPAACTWATTAAVAPAAIPRPRHAGCTHTP